MHHLTLRHDGTFWFAQEVGQLLFRTVLNNNQSNTYHLIGIYDHGNCRCVTIFGYQKILVARGDVILHVMRNNVNTNSL